MHKSDIKEDAHESKYALAADNNNDNNENATKNKLRIDTKKLGPKRVRFCNDGSDKLLAHIVGYIPLRKELTPYDHNILYWSTSETQKFLIRDIRESGGNGKKYDVPCLIKALKTLKPPSSNPDDDDDQGKKLAHAASVFLETWCISTLRGMESIVCHKFRKRRDIIMKTLITSVLGEQERLKNMTELDSKQMGTDDLDPVNVISHVAKMNSRKSRLFALAMGHADAKALTVSDDIESDNDDDDNCNLQCPPITRQSDSDEEDGEKRVSVQTCVVTFIILYLLYNWWMSSSLVGKRMMEPLDDGRTTIANDL